MHFASPAALRLLPPILLLFVAVLLLSAIRRRRRLSLLVDPVLHPRIMDPGLVRSRTLKDILTVFAVTFLLLALARPQWGRRTEEVGREGQDIVFAVDVSTSMLAEDIPPNRLERAKSELAAFLEALEGDRVGLVLFAGKAYLQCPLTTDHGAVGMYLGMLDPGLVPVPGTALADAIRVATGAFEADERTHKVLLLLTDGEDHEGGAVEAARKAAGEGVVIHVVGIGSTEGHPIPIRDASGRLVAYKKDRQDRVVTTRLDEGLLRAIAEAAGGRYLRAGVDASGLRTVLRDISRMDKKAHGTVRLTRYEDRFEWFLWPGVLLFLAGVIWPERWMRRKTMTVLVLAVAFLPEVLPADTVSCNNRGNRHYRHGRFEESLRWYERALETAGRRPDPDRLAVVRHNMANALARTGALEKALESYRMGFLAKNPKLRAANRYGAGQVHLMRGEWDAAVREFVEALRLDPSDRDAKRGLEHALRQMRRPPPPASGGSGGGKEGNGGKESPQEGRDPERGGKASAEPQNMTDGMTRQQAEAVLRALEEQERQNLERNKRRLFAPDGARYVEKDW